jgi:hypothetical protein
VRDVLGPGAVQLGVRPEGWRLDQPDGVAVRIDHIERIPTEQAAFIYGAVAGHDVVAVAPLDYPDREYAYLTPDLDRAYFFEAEGERVLHNPGVLELF